MHTKIKELPHRKHFISKMGKNLLIAISFLSVSLAIGVWGYHYFMHLGFADSLINASMILSGMGPLEPLKTDAGKLFAGFYALYSGVAFLIAIAVALAPVLHRFFHRFHLETEEDKKPKISKIKAKK